MNGEVENALRAIRQAAAAYAGGEWAKAEQLAKSIVDAQAEDFGALSMLGVIAAQTRRPQEAAEWFSRAAAADPANASAHFNYGHALQDLKRFEEALHSYGLALRIKPDFAEAYNNRGMTLHELQRFSDALDNYARALEIRPDYAEAYNNRGVTLLELARFEDALCSLTRALDIRSDYADCYYNRAKCLRELNRPEDALDSYARALQIEPDYAEAYNSQGGVLRELGRYDDALCSYERALEIDPNCEWLYGDFLYTKMQLCDWSNLDSHIADLPAKIRQTKQVTPFAVLVVMDCLRLQRQAAETSVREKFPASPPLRKPPRRDRIRVGYFSADYHNHATASLTAELFEIHDRRRFELIAISFGPDKRDDMRGRLSAAFDKFVDVRARSDGDVARCSRDMGIDIAVDLKGFTEGARTGIFAARSAPIQVNYLGYPGTMGAPFIDYLIADQTLIPENSRAHYAEKIVFLPNSYQVNDRKRKVSDRVFARSELGLPSTGFVFCCFNNTFKITPGTFDGWMRILDRVEGSVLWLFENNATAASNLRRAAEARGVNSGRLVFARPMPYSDHLARYRVADLFVDTLPCNAHTTASDALWMGLPVLTRVGQSFAARVCASLLNAIGLSDLVTTNQDQYERTAIELAINPGRLAELKGRLRRNRSTTPLFDTAGIAGHLENAYTQMYERYHADMPPDDIYTAS